MSTPAPARPRRDWPVLQLPVLVRAYVVGVPLAALLLVAPLALRAAPSWSDLRLAAVLLGAGLVCVEATRRVGEPANTLVKDVLSVWWLAMALLLPPVYALVAPLPVLLATQHRVRPALLHRRLFSAGAAGLSYAGASAAFHALSDGLDPAVVGSGRLRWLLDAALVGAGAAAVTGLLVVVAVHAVNPETRWRQLLVDAGNVQIEGVEICLGLLVAVGAAYSPALVLLAVPPVLVLQRGLLLRQLRAAARLDAKTGLANAGTWELEAAGVLHGLQRRAQPAGLLLIDIDHFKAVNDRHGHLVGDQVLAAVAGALTSGIRAGDLLGRFGGEEFVALLPASDDDEADAVAERLRQLVADLVVRLPTGAAVTVTVSIGLGVSHGPLSLPDLLVAADSCLYRAKAEGRNRVVR